MDIRDKKAYRRMYVFCMVVFFIFLLFSELVWATIFLVAGVVFNELEKMK